MKTGQGRQAELDAFAVRKHWKRGSMKSWRVSRLSIAVASRGWPKANFIATVRGTWEKREFTNIEDLARFVDAVMVTGQIPAPSS